LEDRRISAKSIAEQLGISRERVGSIIHEDLDILVACFLHGRANDLLTPLYTYIYMYIFTAIGLTPGGSGTVHIHTQTAHRTTQLICEECGPCPVFAGFALTFALQLREKHGKKLMLG
jgi:hypothetical protein